MVGWIERLFKKEQEIVQSLEIKSEAILTSLDPNDFGLKMGMWVKDAEGKIGILTDHLKGEITYTKADGTTVMILSPDDKVIPKQEIHALNTITRASLEEVPVNRRFPDNSGNPDHEKMKAAGYQ